MYSIWALALKKFTQIWIQKKSLQVPVSSPELVLTMVFCQIHFFLSRNSHALSTIAKYYTVTCSFFIELTPGYSL